MKIRFGPAGNSDSFYAEGNKSSLQMPRWLEEKGLNAYEYQCSRGVKIGEGAARELGERARQYGVALSIHAPYYINLAVDEYESRRKTTKYLLDSLAVARWMGAGIVVFHPGSAKPDRSLAMARARRLLGDIVRQAGEEGMGDILLAPETMGKKSLLGSLDEVLELCSSGPGIIPTIDFGHLHAVCGGGLLSEEAFGLVLERIVKALGRDALNNLHIHFSPVEFSGAGEKKHRTTRDQGFGPDFRLLAGQLAEQDARFTVICESDGLQAEDALVFKSMYEEEVSKRGNISEP